jgi:hypothetical protein
MPFDLPQDTSPRILQFATALALKDARKAGEQAVSDDRISQKLSRAKDLHELVWGIEILCANTDATKFRYVVRDQGVDEDVEAVQVLHVRARSVSFDPPYRAFSERPFSAFPVWLQEAIGNDTVRHHEGAIWWVDLSWHSATEAGDWLVRRQDGRITVVRAADVGKVLHPVRAAPAEQIDTPAGTLRTEIARVLYERHEFLLSQTLADFTAERGAWWEDADRILALLPKSPPLTDAALACLCESAAPGYHFVKDVTGDPEYFQEPVDAAGYRHGFVSHVERLTGIRSTEPDGPGDVRVVHMCKLTEIRSFGISTKNKSVVWAEPRPGE